MSLSVVALPPPSALYREEQRFGWWAYTLLALLMGLTWYLFVIPGAGGVPGVRHLAPQFAGFFLPATLLPALLAIGMLRMTTVVTPTEIRVWFGWIPTYRKALPIGTVARVEVVRYRPIVDYGGWGVCHGRDGERVLHARGDRGVRLHLLDGSRLLIGSQRPEELALAVEGSLRPGL